MFTKVQGSGRLVLIGCTKCQQGERLPYHPTWRSIDLYHFCVDNAKKGTIPVFKFPEMTASDYDYIREHITLGKLQVTDIIDDEEVEADG